MANVSWKNRQPASLQQAMEWCISYARVKHNRSVAHIADLMGQSNKWVIYKWLENGRLPAILIRSFESACGVDYLTRYIGHSAHKLLIAIPSGKKATSKDINQMQSTFSETVALLLKFHEGEADCEAVLASIYLLMEQLAWHRGTLEKHRQPDLICESETLPGGQI